MFKKALVPLDYSEVAPGILPYVSSLAKALNIPVELVSVLDRGNLDALEKTAKHDPDEDGRGLPVTRLAETGGPPVTFEEAMREDGKGYSPFVIENAVLPLERWLGNFVAQLNQEKVTATGRVAVGNEPAEEILRLASEHGADFIAMATHDRNLLGQAIRGSATNEVIRSAAMPVLVIAPEKDETPLEQAVTITSILAPLDGSPFAEAVLPYVENLAQRLSLEVVLLRVVQVMTRNAQLPLAGGAGEPVGPGGAQAQVEAEPAEEEEAVQYLKQVAESLARKGLRVRWELLGGVTSPSVAGLAQRLPNNMIALASHGRSGLARWVLGSIAEDLIRVTGDPVLVIPAQLAAPERAQG